MSPRKQRSLTLHKSQLRNSGIRSNRNRQKHNCQKKVIVLVQIGGEIVVLLRSDYSKKSF